MAVGYYILIAYVRIYFELCLFIIFLGLYSYISTKIWVKTKPFVWIKKRVKGELYGFVRFILLLAIVGGLFYLSIQSVNILNYLIDFLYTFMG